MANLKQLGLLLKIVFLLNVTGNQASTNEPKCGLTTSVRCTFPSPSTQAMGCLSASEVKEKLNIQLPEDGSHFCEIAPNNNQQETTAWAKCDKGCFGFEDTNTPKQFNEENDAVMMTMCKTVPMPCHFPFTYKGTTYQECTNDPLGDSAPSVSDETGNEAPEARPDFRWCATQVDNNGNMIEGSWGMCDYETCDQIQIPEYDDEETESEPTSIKDETLYAEVEIAATESNKISATIKFVQSSADAPLSIKGTVTGLPPGKHGFHVHQIADTSNQCLAAGPHFNPANSVHGSQISSERHAGDFGNIEADSEGTAEIDIEIPKGSLSTLFGTNTIIGRTLVIHEGEDDLGTGSDEESSKTGNAGKRLACAIIEPVEGGAQEGLARIIIIILIVIIVLLLILITALVIYCCKKKRQISIEKGEEGVPFQNGDTKKKPLAYDELSIPFIDASPGTTPKVGRSTERLSFFNRTPSIGRSRGSLSAPDQEKPKE